jgi:hypothetical protein
MAHDLPILVLVYGGGRSIPARRTRFHRIPAGWAVRATSQAM